MSGVEQLPKFDLLLHEVQAAQDVASDGDLGLELSNASCERFLLCFLVHGSPQDVR
ncbi:MAG: hypothetical protein QOI47_1162 [Actinomycetota bacterium]|nr:hypothetical protein [Actinomycetota bacterium]